VRDIVEGERSTTTTEEGKVRPHRNEKGEPKKKVFAVTT